MQAQRQEIYRRLVSAFAKGRKLSKARRVKIAAKMGWALWDKIEAGLVAIKYAMGQIEEHGRKLRILIRAWLVLGESTWQKVFRYTQKFQAACA